MSLYLGMVWGREGEITKHLNETFGDNEYVRYLHLMIFMISWVYECVKSYQIVYFTELHFILCQLYLNKTKKL